jgi:LCP family protein required for cell wall assembly
MVCASDLTSNGEKAHATSRVFNHSAYTLLLAGLDRDPHSANRDRRTDLHTDSLVLLFSRVGSGEINALHIPRDTLVYTPGAGMMKINSIRMFYGETTFRLAVERLTGFDVKAVVYTDFPQFKNAFRQLGRVPFFVDRTIDSPESQVRIAPGTHLLSPDEALAVARFRHEPLGDVGRVKRQAKLLHAAITCLHRLPLPAFQTVVTTLDPQITPQVAYYSYYFLHRMKTYHAYMLPGRFGVGREFGDFVVDASGMRAIKQALISTKPQPRETMTWKSQLDARDVGEVKIL